MLDNFFKFSENGTDFKTEIIAGITTFLAMAYILGVNPVILADGGMPATGVFFATAVASGIACIIMGLVAKYPVGLAPGMGLNALFTYTIILGMGNTWETALAAVFISSIIFLIITISGLREAILNAIPLDLKLGIGAAIGCFLAFLGLKGAGIIVADPSTFVTMGSLMTAPALLALIGIIITLILYVKKVPAAVFIGLIVTAIIGVIFTAVSNNRYPRCYFHTIRIRYWRHVNACCSSTIHHHQFRCILIRRICKRIWTTVLKYSKLDNDVVLLSIRYIL